MQRSGERTGDFDVEGLFRALDTRRATLNLSWAGVAGQMWELSAELNRCRPADHPISPTTITGMAKRGNTTCQHALIFLRWLDRTPESFLSDPKAGTDLPVRPSGPDSRTRWDLPALYDALNTARLERDLTWPQLARQMGCTSNQLTGIRTARYAINMVLAMRIVQWLERPSADFIYAARW